MTYTSKTIIFNIIGCVLLFSCKDSPKTSQKESEAPTVTSYQKAPTLTITPIEHATAVLQWDDITIYIDPVGGKDAFRNQKEADLILITDIHGDHFSLSTLEALNTQKAKIIVPQAVADNIPSEFTPLLDILNNGDSKERFGITIEAIPMYNLREAAKDFHPKGRGNGYILSKNGTRIYFSGDTEDIPEIRALQNIDKAFICMNLPYTMTVESAADAVLAFKPKEVYPYHYRGKPEVSDVLQFKKLVNEKDSTIRVVQLDWYPNEEY
ncbi:L-ascorbate metabolism protein UlaG, beta-lactamase superfamily [Arenibacter nanhaiticus]|uniref:L-ascorbate metabolism protein UlaG, beta-lactamase superfamily n=1 Tax=Arenibacter nanhaiticus TaxID=558155 RepID=A0A1M6DRD8_9FLAO|nr:MBL fold metallo-hydrolase [Arenibacter nanhaiticus]SHI75761.1 L-ascorbate metabolism protein UlaG, beta-lactamase superfamily [Arenibacter nanhaiticus]